MSDFDAALERLVTDPAFRDALAADPTRALAGYRLSGEELEILCSQLDTGSGGDRRVEQRTSMASVFGLLSPLGGSGIGSGVADAMHGVDASQGLGPAGGHTAAASVYGLSGASFGSDASMASFGSDAFGSGSSMASFGSEGDTEGIGALLGQAVTGGQSSGGGPSIDGYPVDEYQPRHGAPGEVSGASGPAGEGIGAAMAAVVTGEPAQAAPLPEPGTSGQGALHSMPSADYHTRVDADGDGRWDRFAAVDRGDGGVDLVVDRDNDGRAEFIGHDFDRDGLIDEAITDTDGDGQLDARWVDDNGDGWLDRRVAAPDPQPSGTLSDLGEGPAAADGYSPADPGPGDSHIRPL